MVKKTKKMKWRNGIDRQGRHIF